jgi:hypothetical protein
VYTITLDRSNEEGVFNQSVAFQLVDLAGAERGYILLCADSRRALLTTQYVPNTFLL